ncbi:general odorant-binding protein 57c [Drosophila mojavensis]|uniref:Odorant-binding protein 57cL1 n=1 Tax=Drosophila mojavensis TaxID=7230 RepID=B4KPI6_DROMO|nr:general odorant-binding protein 57c [Drosophila mojavensis]EDW10182.2 Odorant-binding protein 57cL1 [Drosophila mojavensis]
MFDRTKDTFAAISFALLLVCVQSFPEDEMDEMVTKCLTDNDIEKAEYETLLSQNNSNIDMDSIDKKYKCYLHCMATEMHILDSNGHVDIELVNEHEELTPKDREVFVECKKIHDGGEDFCEYAFSMTMCLLESLES